MKNYVVVSKVKKEVVTQSVANTSEKANINFEVYLKRKGLDPKDFYICPVEEFDN